MHDDSTTQDRDRDPLTRAVLDSIEEAASPTPDAVDRIAQRIADGAPVAVGEGERRRGARRSAARLRPRLAAAGAVAVVAAAIALFAPGGDDSTPTGPASLLDLGPDVAAAEVLRAAGATVGDAPWTPLAREEYFAARRTELIDGRVRLVTETWTAGDGALHQRFTQSPAVVPVGEAFWIPVVECAPRAVAGRAGADPTDLAASVAASACAGDPITGAFVAASTGGGEITDAPPAGAFVEVPPWLLTTDVDARTLRFGTDVVERVGGMPASAQLDGDRGVLLAQGEGDVAALPLGTRWVRRVSGPEVVLDEPLATAPNAAPIVEDVLGPAWSSVFTLDELGALPTDPARLAERLRTESGGATDAAAIQLAVGLLTEAPISPDVAAAAFDALARFTTAEGAGATVDRDAALPDGSRAVAVTFAIDFPARYAELEQPGDGYTLLFDPEASTIRAATARIGGEDDLAEWAVPRRVDRIPTTS